eukprot:TRINITY_DN1090_c0_g1_i3.p1 TRINITY_DN1090_c0_g1~~TRINITY_DN1090_c0_g1_i3.p1  ORF type:complete len:350 (+),score=83.61 TRINITY_DN1090_c0_g1_i3:62-1051(+)
MTMRASPPSALVPQQQPPTSPPSPLTMTPTLAPAPAPLLLQPRPVRFIDRGSASVLDFYNLVNWKQPSPEFQLVQLATEEDAVTRYSMKDVGPATDDSLLLVDNNQPFVLASYRRQLLCFSYVDIDMLRSRMTSDGVPTRLRGLLWLFVLNNANISLKELQEKRQGWRTEYVAQVESVWEPLHSRAVKLGTGITCALNDSNMAMYYQIRMDVVRTHPNGYNNLFSLPEVQLMLHRLLYVWSCGNSFSYFQGLNDIASVLFIVFFHSYFEDLSLLQKHEEDFLGIETDVATCLTLIMDQLQVQCNRACKRASTLMTGRQTFPGTQTFPEK